MRKEFKFVRGLYTDKKLFDNDIVDDSFVILDEKSDKVSFDAKDDNTTQSQLINASNSGRVRKVYTITPDKITMEGNLEKGTEGSFYKFTPTVKTNAVDDGEPIPLNVRTKAKEILEERLEVDYSALTTENIVIGENSIPNSVEVTFTDKSGKSFTRNMTFKASGDVIKRSLVNVGNAAGTSLKNEEVYYFENNEYKRYNINDNDVFHNGIKQELVKGEEKYFPKFEEQLTVENNEAVATDVAHYYIAPQGYVFKVNNNSRVEVGYLVNESGLILAPGSDGSSLQYLPFSPPSRDNIMFTFQADGKYIIKSNKLMKISGLIYPYNNYDFDTEQTVYEIEDSEIENYYVYNKSAYKDDSTDANIYLKLGDPESEPISETTVGMTDIHTPKSIIDLSKKGYTITIKEDTFEITATEV